MKLSFLSSTRTNIYPTLPHIYVLNKYVLLHRVFQTLLSKVSVISKKKSKIVSICSCALVTYKLFHLPKRLQSYLLQHWMRARRTFQSSQLQVAEKGSFARPSSNTQNFDAERIKGHRVPKKEEEQMSERHCLKIISMLDSWRVAYQPSGTIFHIHKI